LVGGGSEETFFKSAVLVGGFLVVALFISNLNDEAVFREELGGDVGAGIDDGGVDKEAVFDAIEEGIAESGLALVTAEGAVCIQQETAFVFAEVVGGGFVGVKFFEI